MSIAQRARPATATRDPVLGLLEQIRDELVALRHAFEQSPRRRSRSASASAIFVALAAVAGDAAFSVRELLHHTRVDSQLRAVLLANDLANTRRLGKWLASLTGATIAGLRLEHVGDDRDGAVWRLFVADSRDPLS